MRFIDGHALMERLQEQTEVVTNHVMVAGLLMAQGVVLETPTIDAVEVVKCKDCKHKVVTEDGEYDPEDIVCEYWMSDGLNSNDYCSYGERKE